MLSPSSPLDVPVILLSAFLALCVIVIASILYWNKDMRSGRRNLYIDKEKDKGNKVKMAKFRNDRIRKSKKKRRRLTKEKTEMWKRQGNEPMLPVAEPQQRDLGIPGPSPEMTERDILPRPLLSCQNHNNKPSTQPAQTSADPSVPSRMRMSMKILRLCRVSTNVNFPWAKNETEAVERSGVRRMGDRGLLSTCIGLALEQQEQQSSSDEQRMSV